MTLHNIFGYTLPELTQLFVDEGLERFRSEQVFYWLYNRAVGSFDEMTNLSKSLRQKLSETFSIQHPHIEIEQQSEDGTRKFLLTLHDRLKIETVLIPSETEEAGFPKRLTLCVSTQVGCPLDCRFCATASMKLKRNLTPGEIVAQYLAIQKQSERRITNMVYMGMGEPMLNYDNVMKSLDIMTHEKTCSISSRHITISTAGIIDGIKRMADESRKAKLAISLHSADDHIRSMLMPINKRYNLDAISQAAEYYFRKTKRRVTYEYILFDGVNDTDEALKKLVTFVRRIPGKVNIIPFHAIGFAFPDGDTRELKSTPHRRFEEFVRKLRNRNVTVMVRSSSGKDINAACGQLAVKVERRHKQEYRIQSTAADRKQNREDVMQKKIIGLTKIIAPIIP